MISKVLWSCVVCPFFSRLRCAICIAHCLYYYSVDYSCISQEEKQTGHTSDPRSNQTERVIRENIERALILAISVSSTDNRQRAPKQHLPVPFTKAPFNGERANRQASKQRAPASTDAFHEPPQCAPNPPYQSASEPKQHINAHEPSSIRSQKTDKKPQLQENCW